MKDSLDIEKQKEAFNFDELWEKYPQEKPIYPKLTANVIKAYLLEHYRFTHRVHMIATECCFADVFYIHETKTKKESTEIEIKISKQDLLNDFKKEKHQAYANNKAYSNIQPDYFYYCVPFSLYMDSKLKDLKLPNDNYGVLTISDSGGVWLEKEAKRLTKEFNQKNYKRLKMRMSSELTTFWTKQYLQEREQ